MGDVAAVVAEFKARPWGDVTEVALGAALRVPTMLAAEEGQFYHWLGRRVTGGGATVDLGAFAGGSAARLLSGLALSGQEHHVFAYDHFRSSARFWARFLQVEPVPETDDNDILPLAQGFLAPWAGRVTLCRGEIAQVHWTGGPIEVLAVDAAKGTAMADQIAAEFYPALAPGRSILVHQDYLLPVQPWLCAQMVRLADHFIPLAQVAKDCVAFLCVSLPDKSALEAAQTNDLTDGALMKRVREAAKWHDGMIAAEKFRAMLQRIKQHPGARLGWQMKNPAGGSQG